MKLNFFLLLLIMPLIGFAQNYEKTLVVEKKWHISQDIGMSSTAHEYYVSTCDTIINAASYFRLDKISPSGPLNPVLIGFAREDTTAQKIYFLDINDNTEELIVDYSLMVGDSFYFVNYSTYIPVVHVDTIQINGKLRKVIHFQGYGQGGPYPRFIAGVGNGFWGVHRNFSSNGVEAVADVLENSGITCANVLPIQPIQNDTKTLRVYPNPAKHSIQIELLDQQQYGFLQQGIIYDWSGKTVASFEIDQQKDISIEQLSSGVYFIKIVGFKPIRLIKQN